jgi:cadmium resistance protein CadD (predicted permease)
MSPIEVAQTLVLAGVMFVATNADDLVLLTIFFAQPNCRPRAIVLGQLAGIGALTAIGYTASMLALAVPHDWLPWIGLVPFVIGVRWLRRAKDDAAPPMVLEWWGVAGITMANGGDNLGVYIPAFAIQTGIQKVVTGLVFGVLTLLWCWIAWSATRHPTWGPIISRMCGRAAPYILMAIGLWIIAHHSIFGLGLANESPPR